MMADAFLKVWPEDGVILDLPAELQISAFFSAFLEQMREHGRLDEARQIHWETKHDFQRDNIARWMHELVVEAA